MDATFYARLDQYMVRGQIEQAEMFLLQNWEAAQKDEKNHADRVTVLNELMDIKAKLRIISPKEPVDRQHPTASTATIKALERMAALDCSLNLWVNLGITSLHSMVEIPRASPAPVPTEAINKVPSTTPPSKGWRLSSTNCVRADLATKVAGSVIERMYRPTRIPNTPMGGIRTAEIMPPRRAALSFLALRIPWA